MWENNEYTLDTNHKTIFILDHTQYFSISSECPLDLDFMKVKSSPFMKPLCKSLWTSSVEGAIEYSRIVWDLFPRGKLIRFVVSDTKAHTINTWANPSQSIQCILNALLVVGLPQIAQGRTENSVIHGLKKAVEALFEPTEQQLEQLKIHKIQNKGRVIVLTSTRDNASMQNLEEIFKTVLIKQNEVVASKPNTDLLPVDFCELIFINIHPMNADTLVQTKPPHKVSSFLSVEVHSCQAGDIPDKLTHLLLSHYDLASTTVTGIPMKEEQNANSSANYDVEILHPRSSHSVICATELSLPKSIKPGSDYETVTLKWCTPRGNGGELQPCLTMHRVTPVDVTSRPSSCLINFLLNGRSVLLEMPRQSGGKINSHLLSARGGEIFIHTLMVARTCLEDPPSISEGEGGRVIDYRLQDFTSFVRNHKLVPIRQITEHIRDENLVKARNKLFRHSKYFPLTVSATIICNIKGTPVEILMDIIKKEDLNEFGLNRCKTLLTNVMNNMKMDFSSNSSNRLKGRYMLMEFEQYIAHHSGKSSGHKELVKLFHDCKMRTGVADLITKGDEVTTSRNMLRTSTDSPQSPPHSIEPPIKKKRNSFSSSNGHHKSLFDIFNSSEAKQIHKRIDFSGRICTPNGHIAKLYNDLGIKTDTAAKDEKDK